MGHANTYEERIGRASAKQMFLLLEHRRLGGVIDSLQQEALAKVGPLDWSAVYAATRARLDELLAARAAPATGAAGAVGDDPRHVAAELGVVSAQPDGHDRDVVHGG